MSTLAEWSTTRMSNSLAPSYRLYPDQFEFHSVQMASVGMKELTIPKMVLKTPTVSPSRRMAVVLESMPPPRILPAESVLLEKKRARGPRVSTARSEPTKRSREVSIARPVRTIPTRTQRVLPLEQSASALRDFTILMVLEVWRAMGASKMRSVQGNVNYLIQLRDTIA